MREQSPPPSQPSRETQLEAALRDMFAMIDEGLLVRSIVNDHEGDFHLRMVKFMQRLQRAHAPLSQQSERPSQPGPERT